MVDSAFKTFVYGVGMTVSSTKSYVVENHCFNSVILNVFPLRTRKQKTTFEHIFDVFITKNMQ